MALAVFVLWVADVVLVLRHQARMRKLIGNPAEQAIEPKRKGIPKIRTEEEI